MYQKNTRLHHIQFFIRLAQPDFIINNQISDNLNQHIQAMKKIFLISLLFCVSAGIISCKKAGLGGNATLVAFPKHHGEGIYGATVYVKFNSKDAAGDLSNYDKAFVGEEKEDHVHLEGLKQGNYYCYAVGYDSSISQVVTGGGAFTIKHKDRKEEQDVDIAVTE